MARREVIDCEMCEQLDLEGNYDGTRTELRIPTGTIDKKVVTRTNIDLCEKCARSLLMQLVEAVEPAVGAKLVESIRETRRKRLAKLP